MADPSDQNLLDLFEFLGGGSPEFFGEFGRVHDRSAPVHRVWMDLDQPHLDHRLEQLLDSLA